MKPKPLKQPLPEGIPILFRCSACEHRTTVEPDQRVKQRWVCLQCGSQEVRAYEVSKALYGRTLEAELPEKKPSKRRPFRFDRAVRAIFQASDGVSRAAFKAEQLAEYLSHRRPKDSDEKGFIDGVTFDIARFNMRAQMVVEIVMVKRLLEEAGLPEYVSSAVHRILDARLGPRISRLGDTGLPSESAKE